ncbi:magnesium transporter MRS2 homolog, mitochondrial isoform X4 [Phascolarctos cinereus]
MDCVPSLARLLPRAVGRPQRGLGALALTRPRGALLTASSLGPWAGVPLPRHNRTGLPRSTWLRKLCEPRRPSRSGIRPLPPPSLLSGPRPWIGPGGEILRLSTSDASQATLASVAPVFTVTKFDKEGNVSSFERKKIELYQELGLQARDLRFQHLMSITTRNNRIIMRMEINTLQGKLSLLQPLILETLEALVDPKHSSVDRSKLHILLQNSKSLSELETDIKVFKESILEILDEEELMEELCLTKWSDPEVFEKSSTGIDHAEEMELLLENYYRLADDLSNKARELRVLIDDSESIIFINLDSHRNVMMRLNLQLTMGTFSLSLFGLMGVAFGMNLESSLEEDHRVFWLVTGIMFMGSGLIWRRLLSFLGRQLEAPLPPMMPSLPKKPLQASGRIEMKNSLRTDAFGSSRSILTNR